MMVGRCTLCCLLLCCPVAIAAEEFFRCAGPLARPAGKAVQVDAGLEERPAAPAHTSGTRRALVLFAGFAGGDEGGVPDWADAIFDPQRPGSFSHFFDTMSFGRLRVRGEVAPRRYRSARRASSYLASEPGARGQFGLFSEEILRAADADIDFARYDNDGPDGLPDSGDDDGVVDAVFIVLDAVPRDFILGGATGVSILGLEGSSFATGDTGADGQPIRIEQGTVQGGNTYPLVVGTLCHEYGHVLGLPDLFNTDFTRSGDPSRPQDDSAGIGRWGLMGWGATGWNGGDGPNSLSAWSRLQLGWARLIEPEGRRDAMDLEDVGVAGAVYRIPLGRRDFFLLEHRRRQSTHYDRNLPGEGLLIWHVGIPSPLVNEARVDLECADGRFADAGFPLGQEADAPGGEDNLDFWAHDTAYSRAHGGNQGDATDPFDGRTYRSFTPETNPAAFSRNGLQHARVENIRIEGGRALADIEFLPLQVEITRFRLVDEDGERLTLAGEEVRLSFRVEHVGGEPLAALKARLSSDDPLVEIVREEVELGLLQPGDEINFGTQNLAFRFREDFVGRHRALVRLELHDGENVLAREEFSAEGRSLRQRVVAVGLVDSAGNGDGLPQAGEPVHVRLDLDVSSGRLSSAFSFALRPLSGGVRLSPLSVARDTLDAAAGVHRVSSAEFLLDGGLEPGSVLRFEFEVSSRFAAWRDTVELAVAEGGDRTPPRVGFLRVSGDATPQFALAAERVLDGSALSAVEAVISRAGEEQVLAAVPLSWDGEAYRGVWGEGEPGRYWVQAAVEDEAGNRGLGPPAIFSVRDEGEAGPAGFGEPAGRADGLPRWEWLGPRQGAWREEMLDLEIAPGDGRVAYLLTAQGLWRSLDRLRRWDRVGLMVDDGGGEARVMADIRDPAKVYYVRPCAGPACIPVLAQSRDGGISWRTLATPDPGGAEDLLAVGAGRLFLLSRGQVWVSENDGLSWRQSAIAAGPVPPHFVDRAGVVDEPSAVPMRVVTNATRPELVYAAGFGAGEDALLRRSEDGGDSWETYALSLGFDPTTLRVQPAAPLTLYGISGFPVTGYCLLRHQGGGQDNRWREYDSLGDDYPLGLVPDAFGRVFAWSEDGLRIYGRRAFRGRVELPFAVQQDGVGPVRDLAPTRQDSAEFYLVPQGSGQELWLGQDDGNAWGEIAVERGVPPVSGLWIDPQGEILAASGSADAAGRQRPALYASADRGATWEERPSRIAADGVFDLFRPDPAAPRFVLAASGGLLYWSADGGTNWRQILSEREIFEPYAGHRPALLSDPQRPGVYYIGDGLLYRSEDFGTAWEPMPESPFGRAAAFALDASVVDGVYALADRRLWRSRDGGLTWEGGAEIGGGQPLLHLAVAPEKGVLYAAGRRRLYRSADGGENWAGVLEADVGAWHRPALRFVPGDPETAYFMTGYRLFASADRGLTWRSLDRDLAGWPWINDVAPDPEDPSLLYAATAQGVYRFAAADPGTAVAEEKRDLPGEFALEESFPNPFNGSAAIRFSLPQAGRTRLAVYNTAGQRVAVLLEGEREAGRHILHWDGRDAVRAQVGSGVYFVRLEAQGRTDSRKLLLLR